MVLYLGGKFGEDRWKIAICRAFNSFCVTDSLTDSLTDTQTDFIICLMLLTHWTDKNAPFRRRHTVFSIAIKKCKFVTASASGKLCPHPHTKGVPLHPLEESQITSQDQVGSTNFITLPAPLLTWSVTDSETHCGVISTHQTCFYNYSPLMIIMRSRGLLEMWC